MFSGILYVVFSLSTSGYRSQSSLSFLSVPHPLQCPPLSLSLSLHFSLLLYPSTSSPTHLTVPLSLRPPLPLRRLVTRAVPTAASPPTPTGRRLTPTGAHCRRRRRRGPRGVRSARRPVTRRRTQSMHGAPSPTTGSGAGACRPAPPAVAQDGEPGHVSGRGWFEAVLSGCRSVGGVG